MACVATLMLAVPITDRENQRSSLYPAIPGHSNTFHDKKSKPILIRQTAHECHRAGFFASADNCSRFYRCVEVGETGYFTLFNFECLKGQVFHSGSASCIPGVCSPTEKPTVQVTNPPIIQAADPPQTALPFPLWNPPETEIQDVSPSTLPPAPPPSPPPQPTPPPTSTQSNLESQGPQWMNIPTWFKEGPWWFKTAPSWFHQPPAWFNAPPSWFNAQPGTQIITEEKVVDDSEPKGDKISIIGGRMPYAVNKNSIKMDNLTIDGISDFTVNDNKTLRIHIPIHIVQQ
ncbi:uncharacterized protein [Palaemon carinicauda]|uniref:uncharacterized protein n=1 Tax=Palaemon carinicauda TaxID=392227 RepID=UPI0035B6083B